MLEMTRSCKKNTQDRDITWQQCIESYLNNNKSMTCNYCDNALWADNKVNEESFERDPKDIAMCT